MIRKLWKSHLFQGLVCLALALCLAGPLLNTAAKADANVITVPQAAINDFVARATQAAKDGNNGKGTRLTSIFSGVSDTNNTCGFFVYGYALNKSAVAQYVGRVREPSCGNGVIDLLSRKAGVFYVRTNYPGNIHNTDSAIKHRCDAFGQYGTVVVDQNYQPEPGDIIILGRYPWDTSLPPEPGVGTHVGIYVLDENGNPCVAHSSANKLYLSSMQNDGYSDLANYYQGVIGYFHFNTHDHQWNDRGQCAEPGCDRHFDWDATAAQYAGACGLYKALSDTMTSTVPYSKGDDNGRLTKGATYSVIKIVTNHFGNNNEHKWYGVDLDGNNTVDTWAFNKYMSYVRPFPETITVSFNNSPISLTQGDRFDVTGSVTSKYAIKQIKVYFVAAGATTPISSPAPRTVAYGNVTQVDLSGRVAENAWFQNLPVGRWQMALEVENVNSDKVIKYTSPFIVKEKVIPMGRLTLMGSVGSDLRKGLLLPDGTPVGTCSVYINGRLCEENVSYYDETWPIGTYYEIVDVRGVNSYRLIPGVALNLSGTVGEETYPMVGFEYHEPVYYSLTISGLCDDVPTVSTAGFATFDVYINNVLAADDVTSYYALLLEDTDYDIRDIRPAYGKSVFGPVEGRRSDVMTKNISVVLMCDTLYGTLYVDGYQDNISSETILGTMNVYINNALAAENVDDFEGTYPIGTPYRIELVSVQQMVTYNGVVFARAPGCGGLAGVIGDEDYYVYLSFTPELDGIWSYADALPEGVTAEEYDIEYYNYFSTVAAQSPGPDWVQGEMVQQEYVPVGDIYTSDIELATSNERRLVRWYYYHYCGGSMGKLAEHYMTGGYVHYDQITDVNSVTEASVHQDDTMPEYKYYVLKWKDGSYAYCQSGVTCDGSYGTHGKRSYYWYKRCVYQDYALNTAYRFTKESGWTDQPDAGASYTTVRYRKKYVEPIWAEDLTLPAVVEVNLSEGYLFLDPILSPEGANEAVGWESKSPDIATVENGVVTLREPGVAMIRYATRDVEKYVVLIVHPAQRLVIPKGTRVIEANAFEGLEHLQEVVLPAGLERVESGAFSQCWDLRIVSCPADAAVFEEYPFTAPYAWALCSDDSRLAALIDEDLAGLPRHIDPSVGMQIAE